MRKYFFIEKFAAGLFYHPLFFCKVFRCERGVRGGRVNEEAAALQSIDRSFHKQLACLSKAKQKSCSVIVKPSDDGQSNVLFLTGTMRTLSGYIRLGDEQLHHLSMGSGRKLLLAFHGYNNTAQIFQPFVSYLGREYTIISIDLPHHGKSEWPEVRRFDVSQLKQLIKFLLEEYKVDKLSLMGYSLGGRVCLKAVELMPGNIDKVLLIAPDGLAFNPFYYFLTRTAVGSNIFRRFLTDPQRYMGLIEFARRRKWLDESRYKFAMQYLQTESARNFLLRVWPGMSRLIPSSVKLRSAIKRHSIPVHVFMGSYDRIIPVPLAKKFKKELETVQLHILDKGHRVFDSETLPQMAQCFLS
jgi:pimeloyl-ACP methyl ester carboxylesterase